MADITERGSLKKDDNGVAVGWKYSNITAAAPTTTVVKNGPGVLHCITFNKPTATAVVTIYNNTAASGSDLVGTITVPASPMPVTLFYDVAMSVGITITTATAASDITVSYI